MKKQIFQFYRSHRTFVLLIFIFAVLRLLSVIVILFKGVSLAPVQDALEYFRLAENILTGRPFAVSPIPPFAIDVLRTPVYPIFLAGTLIISKTGYLAIILQQFFWVCIAGLVGWALYRQGRRRAAMLAIIFVLVEPLAWFLSLQTMSESLFTLCIFGSIYILLYSRWKRKNIWLIFVGILTGLAILIRPVGMLWVPSILVVAIWDRHWLKRVLLVFIFLALTVLPWAWRNHSIIGDWTLSTSSTYNLVLGFGTSDQAGLMKASIGSVYDSKGREGRVILGFTAPAYPTLKKYSQEIVKTAGPVNLLWQSMICGYRAWLPSNYATVWEIFTGNKSLGKVINILDWVFWLGMAVLSILGATWLGMRRRWLEMIVLALPIIFTIIFSLCVSYGRMRVPLQPLIALLSGYGLIWLANLLKKGPK